MNFKLSLGLCIPVGLAACLLACGADATSKSPRVASPQPARVPTAGQSPQLDGTSGSFSSVPAVPVISGVAGTTSMLPVIRPRCTGGLYLGTYSCNLDIMGTQSTLEGEVSFELEVNDAAAPAGCQEFCPDLVIAEGSGTLFGLAVGFGFGAKLEGGRDCQTGEFRAKAPNGSWGFGIPKDFNDPEGAWTVLDPAFGEFTGTLDGRHDSGMTESIAGDWDLTESASGNRCKGPFTTALQR